ncbi:MAG TPA: glycosyltransferase family 39 protein [Blastocatellia bacterium]|nr:glycosyltransferase family 39 protein [Blastocatellia bacterium]
MSSPTSSEQSSPVVSSGSRTGRRLARLSAIFRLPDSEQAALVWTFAAVAAITILLRICYSTHLYEDDGLWIAAAEELLRGKALYREIYIDKPPGIVLVYASLFRIFGPHLSVIRLFTILYSIAVSIVVYRFGTDLYDKRAGRIAALLFAVFSTTGPAGHMQALNTDFLAILPYAASAWLFSRAVSRIRASRLLAVFSGLLTAIAFQLNPKALADLLFFAALPVTLLAAIRVRPELFTNEGISTSGEKTSQRALRAFAFAVIGFIAGSLPFFLYIVATRAWTDYTLFVWHWGARYTAYFPFSSVLTKGFPAFAGYFALNNTLLVTAACAVFWAARRILNQRTGGSTPPDETLDRERRLDGSTTVVVLWFAVSTLGLCAGGRFYAHYFFQIVPALCLLGARGSAQLIGWLRSRPIVVRAAAVTVLALGFSFTLIRFHGRTAILAADWLSGSQSAATASWRSEVLNHEERAAAAVVRDLGDADAASLGIESIREGGPRDRDPKAAADYLFVWGYRPEIYFWSGLLPASRYLSTQQLTGVPADVHLINGENRSIIDDNLTTAARAELVADLSALRPKYIVDELGFFNSSLAIDNYPELAEFLRDYKNLGATGRFFIYRRRDMSGKRGKSADGGVH